MSHDAEWRSKVGQRVRERREELYRSRRAAALAAGVNEAVLRSTEDGSKQVAKGVIQPYRPSGNTSSQILRMLRWSPDSFDLLLAGKNPVAVDDGPPAPALPVGTAFSSDRLNDYSDEELAHFAGIIEGVRFSRRRNK